MPLLRYKAFDRLRREVKEKKLKENEANRYKKFYLEILQQYGVSDASELPDDKLSEFLDSIKNYRKNNINE
jgi:hypothetical protein